MLHSNGSRRLASDSDDVAVRQSAAALSALATPWNTSGLDVGLAGGGGERIAFARSTLLHDSMDIHWARHPSLPCRKPSPDAPCRPWCTHSSAGQSRTHGGGSRVGCWARVLSACSRAGCGAAGRRRLR